MIAHLSGTLLSKQPTAAIIDVGGVGYEVSIPVSTFYELGENGSPAQLRVYTHVSQDAIRLYGFKTARERELFLQLISVNGVGPALAIKLLSGMNADEMIAAIRTNNLVRLVAIPGVGRKTAERLVVDLRDKIAALSSPALEEEFALARSFEAVQLQRVFADVRIDTKLHLRSVFPKFIKSRERNRDFITNAADIDNRRGRLL